MDAQAKMEFFATTARGLERALHHELAELGITRRRITSGGVAFSGDLEAGYRACLWSRVASRVLLTLRSGQVTGPDALYAFAREVDWIEHLGVDDTLAVDARLRDAPIDNSQFAAVRVKDAVVDQLRERFGSRPSVDRGAPDVRLNLTLRGTKASLAIDLSGDALHRRGYRAGGAKAPLKENLAAALLTLAGWSERIDEPDAALLDPACGAGTFPIEAALIASDTAPGLLRLGEGREGFGLQRERGFDAALWDRLVAEANERDRRGDPPTARLFGFDVDASALTSARQNAEEAGVAAWIEWRRGGIGQRQSIEAPAKSGLVMVNPPYGERIGDERSVEVMYRELADALRGPLSGWDAAVISANERIEAFLGRVPRARHDVYNGALACQLLRYGPAAERQALAADSAFANRLRKRSRHLAKWAKRRGVSCYRVYDADLPQYNVAVDRYDAWIHVQEYAAPKEVDPEEAAERLREVMVAVSEVLEVPPERVFLKVRRRQRGRDQYEREADDGRFVEVEEGGHRFLVNLSDYLDTGLFLDHRDVRAELGALAKGARFLNLFCYTGSATVYAVGGGAVESTSVDMSNTYLSWARRNFDANGIDERKHWLVRADCLTWLEQARGEWDLIFLDPPTFSNSTRMETDLDVQRDHVTLITNASRLLTKGGTLVFSTNHRRFSLDEAAMKDAGLLWEDWSRRTLPQDFERNPKIHQVFALWRA